MLIKLTLSKPIQANFPVLGSQIRFLSHWHFVQPDTKNLPAKARAVVLLFYMLKKTERLDRASFSNYFKKGKRIHGTYVTIVTCPAPTLFGAVVVGKKVSKKAVTRNSIRRRLYGILDVFRNQKNFNGVYIIIAKPEINKLNKKQFQENLTEEIGRALK